MKTQSNISPQQISLDRKQRAFTEIFIAWFILLSMLTNITVSAQPTDKLVLKKRVAVMEFKNKVTSQQVTTGNSSIGYTSTEEASSNLTDMLITELVKSNNFIVYERDRMNAILKEQQFNSGENVTPQSAIKLHQMLGVQLIVTGSITEFSLKSEKNNGQFVYVKTAKTEQTARVVVDLRVINASTGEILFAESAIGEQKSQSGGLSIRGIGSNTGSADLSILDKAKRVAIQKCVELISLSSEQVQWSGDLVKMKDANTVIMTPGSAGGVKPGMKLIVYSKGEEIIDPQTGLSLGFDLIEKGQIEVVGDFGEGKACIARIISGQGFQQGDKVKMN